MSRGVASLENGRIRLGENSRKMALRRVPLVNPTVQIISEKAVASHLTPQRARRDQSGAPRSKSSLPTNETGPNCQTAPRAARKIETAPSRKEKIEKISPKPKKSIREKTRLKISRIIRPFVIIIISGSHGKGHVGG